MWHAVKSSSGAKRVNLIRLQWKGAIDDLLPSTEPHLKMEQLGKTFKEIIEQGWFHLSQLYKDNVIGSKNALLGHQLFYLGHVHRKIQNWPRSNMLLAPTSHVLCVRILKACRNIARTAAVKSQLIIPVRKWLEAAQFCLVSSLDVPRPPALEFKTILRQLTLPANQLTCR